MSAIDLNNSLDKLKKCYSKDKEGNHTIDGRKLNDNLAFRVAMHRVTVALQNKELTEQEFYDKMDKTN